MRTGRAPTLSRYTVHVTSIVAGQSHQTQQPALSLPTKNI